MNDRYKVYVILMVIVLCMMAISALAFANLVVYVIHWEQNETEWLEVRTYGQEGDVYITFESSFRPMETFHIPAEFAGLLGSQIQQAAQDAVHSPQEVIEVQ